MRYDVNVGNIGTVYSGDDKETALSTFNVYVEQSRDGYGRAAGESVTLIRDEEIVKEYVGSIDEKGDE